jgi:hypothetical protein
MPAKAREVILFATTSVDGFIAGTDGSPVWSGADDGGGELAGLRGRPIGGPGPVRADAGLGVVAPRRHAYLPLYAPVATQAAAEGDGRGHRSGPIRRRVKTPCGWAADAVGRLRAEHGLDGGRVGRRDRSFGLSGVPCGRHADVASGRGPKP